MEMPQPAQSVLRRVHTSDELTGGPARIYELQGTVQFSGAERVLRALAEEPPTETEVLFDLSRVHAVNRVATRMLWETGERLVHEGHRVTFLDPEEVLPVPVPGERSGAMQPGLAGSLAELAR